MRYVFSSPLLLLLGAIIILCFSPHLPRCIPTDVVVDHHPLYLSPSTFFTDYQRMIASFKIYPYPNLNTTTPNSLFHTSLLSSPFITPNPSHARLFYLPIPADLPTRSLDRLISRLRSSLPFWNLSLAADHFFLSSCSPSTASAPPSSSRNVVELRKNAVRLSCFSAPRGYFVPHKDVSLPPPPYLGPLSTHMNESRFCLFVYGQGVEIVGLGEALTSGCVPVIITDRPVQDMPLMDVIRWEEIALFVGAEVGRDRLKGILNNVVDAGDKYDRMKRLGVGAAHHFTWNDPPQPYDAFHMVMYQLWLRSHAVRYSTWQMR